ncbi:GNAT family N-acetyltransferase [Streptomyces virginiae]|uniref:GNAT family N-acetyltransferase n=1 Tax=Streptomyces virginiae TaxID=1961 RepID=UPI00224F11E9|nr:GNAT family N-acetyltransferase [Streptomyces virginiae]MCX4959623.1 GNAT family N-acetyltransferase [Streptomyces virginiae]
MSDETPLTITSGGKQYAIRDAEPNDEADLLALFCACEDYFESATGLPSGPGDVQSLFYSLPEGADWDDKHILVVADETGSAAGLVEAVLGYPTPDTCSVGLFLLHPDLRGAGLGSELAVTLLRSVAARGARHVTATVPLGWEQGERFVASHGFTPTGRPSPRPHVGNRQAGPREPVLNRVALLLPSP